MIDGHLHVYYVIEADGYAEFQVSDESPGGAFREGKIILSQLVVRLSKAVTEVMELKIERSRKNKELPE